MQVTVHVLVLEMRILCAGVVVEDIVPEGSILEHNAESITCDRSIL